MNRLHNKRGFVSGYRTIASVICCLLKSSEENAHLGSKMKSEGLKRLLNIQVSQHNKNMTNIRTGPVKCSQIFLSPSAPFVDYKIFGMRTAICRTDSLGVVTI